MPRKITPSTSLDNLRKEAKRWLKSLRANDPDARARFERAHSSPPSVPVLRDVQHALALEHHCASWIALIAAVEASRAESGRAPSTAATIEDYARAAGDFVAAFDSHDQ